MQDDSQDNSHKDEFQQAMADVDRLEQDKISPYRKKKPPRPLQHLLEQEEDDGFADTHVETPDFLDFMRPGIQHRVYQDLRRGVIEPEATLDLHGMRVVDARKALAGFLSQSLRARRRCVRIIHGKGRGSSSQQPVLKQKVNQWLPQKKKCWPTAPHHAGMEEQVWSMYCCPESGQKYDRPKHPATPSAR